MKSYTGNFNEAFASARRELGSGAIFEWNGKSYTTNYAEELKMAAPRRNKVIDAQEVVERLKMANTYKESKTTEMPRMANTYLKYRDIEAPRFNTTSVDNARNFEEGSNAYEKMSTSLASIFVEPAAATALPGMALEKLGGLIKAGRFAVPETMANVVPKLQNSHMTNIYNKFEASGGYVSEEDYQALKGLQEVLKAFKTPAKYNWSHQSINSSYIPGF